MNATTQEHGPLNVSDHEDRQRVLEQMERILASPPFRHSKRYPVLLRYVVEMTLSGQADMLKERTVGVEAFRRDPEYDTTLDPVVRVTAGEVRKRIAQYYHEEGRQDELRIDLPPGSYVPSFARREGMARSDGRPVEDSSQPIPAPPALHGPDSPAIPHTRLPTRWETVVPLIAGLLLLVLLVAAWGLMRRRSSEPDAAWKPLLRGTEPVLISIGEPRLAPVPAMEQKTSTLTVRDHVYAGDFLVYSDVQSLVRLTGWLDRRGHPYRLQPASATTFGDLRQGPTVLIGGLDNPWAMRAMSGLRYQFRREAKGTCWIEDVKEPGSRRWSVDFNLPYAGLGADYAIIARFISPETHQPVMIVAGVGENGTRAAGEFITDPEQTPLFATAGMEQNVELVLGTQVVNGISGPPRVLAKVNW